MNFHGIFIHITATSLERTAWLTDYQYKGLGKGMVCVVVSLKDDSGLWLAGGLDDQMTLTLYISEPRCSSQYFGLSHGRTDGQTETIPQSIDGGQWRH